MGNTEIRLVQERLFKKTIALGLGVDEDDDHFFFNSKDSHRSSRCELPIASAAHINENVTVLNLSYNFHFYFLAVHLKRAIPATLLRPISGYLGRIALSGHVREKELMVTNFEKAYHNVERMNRFCMKLSSPLQVAAVLRFLVEVQQLPVNEILDEVLYNTRYGCINGINFNAVDSNENLIELCGLDPKDGYCKHDIDNLDCMYESMAIEIYDTLNGGSSLHFTTKEPLLPFKFSGELMVPVTEEQMAAGIGNEVFFPENSRIPIKFLSRSNAARQQGRKGRKDPEYQLKYKMRNEIHCAYGKLPLSAREFTINHRNGLDTIMDAFFLNKCVPAVIPVLEKV